MKEKLLLLHGALGSKKQFAPILDKLAESYEVYLLNFEGHGGEYTEKAFSIELFSENVIDFLDANKIEQINIFGYSMGGYVALYTALKVPQKIKKIITLGTKFNWDMASAQKEVKMLNPDVIEQKVPRFAAKLNEEHQPENWKRVVSKTAQMMLGMASGAKLTEEDFKKINHPVVLGIGSLDNMVSFEETADVSNLLPDSKLIKLENVKHPIDRVDPNQLLDYIMQN